MYQTSEEIGHHLVSPTVVSQKLVWIRGGEMGSSALTAAATPSISPQGGERTVLENLILWSIQ